MLQRLGLAQAMLHQPRLLVLDEPTDGLDPQARADVRKILSELKDRGVTIFLNSHIFAGSGIDLRSSCDTRSR